MAVRCAMVDVRPLALAEVQPGDELLQSALWGRFKERFGWRTLAVRWQAAGGGGTLLTLARATPFGALVYAPGGVPPPSDGSGSALLDQLAPHIAERHRAAGSGGARLGGARPTLIRYDLAWPSPDEDRPPLRDAGRLRRAPVDVQPTSTVVVDLAAPEAQLLARMKAKTRYNIRLAGRRGVAVAVMLAADALGAPLAEWYRLYRGTAARHHITAHDERYFATLFALAAQSVSPEPELYLLSASHRGEPVGGIIVSVCGSMARYLYGASTLRHRSLMGNYALQWAAMRLARDHGCRSYDLYGISPSADADHPWAGLYRFKTGFGGSIVHRPGCWDYALRPLSYLLFRRAEVLRRDYYARLRPRLARLRSRSREAGAAQT